MWLAPGSGYVNDFLEQLQRLSTDSTVVMLAIFGVFALLHSGLAYLRPQGALSAAALDPSRSTPSCLAAAAPKEKNAATACALCSWHRTRLA